MVISTVTLTKEMNHYMNLSVPMSLLSSTVIAYPISITVLFRTWTLLVCIYDYAKTMPRVEMPEDTVSGLKQ